MAASIRGEHSSLFLFDECIGPVVERSVGMGMEVEPLMASGRMSIRQEDPAELTPGQFAHVVRRAVEEDRTRLVVIDSLNGYLNAMPNERFLTLHLHELLAYLGQQGV